jgi:hypothetical protein
MASEFERERLRTHVVYVFDPTVWEAAIREAHVRLATRRSVRRPPMDMQGVIVTGVTGGD